MFPASVTGSTADSWHTSRWHLHTETSQLADKLLAYSAELNWAPPSQRGLTTQRSFQCSLLLQKHMV